MTVDAELVQRMARTVGEQVSEGMRAGGAADGAGQLDGNGVDSSGWDEEDRRMYTRTVIQRAISAENERRLGQGQPPLDNAAASELNTAVLNRMFGLGDLQLHIDNPQVTDIYVNGCDNVHLKWRDGRSTRERPVAATDESLIEMIRNQARRSRHEHHWDPASPVLDLQLPSGDRLNAVAWVSQRPSISIRRHDFAIVRLKELIDLGTINEALFQLLSAMVRARFNILVAGGTGAGKTTLLRCLLNEIPPDERLVTVEDSLEIGLARFAELHPNHVELEARESNIEGTGEVTMHDLVRAGLRMGPDRVIVGEIRGAEVVPMLLAMSQGNDGSMSTVHADSTAGTFPRLQAYMAMTPERFDTRTANLMVANAVDVIVHVARRRDGRRVLTSVREVTGADGELVVSNEVYGPDASMRAQPNFRFEDATLARLEHVRFDRRWLEPSANRWGSTG